LQRDVPDVYVLVKPMRTGDSGIPNDIDGGVRNPNKASGVCPKVNG
jgi:hypothetical protein